MIWHVSLFHTCSLSLSLVGTSLIWNLFVRFCIGRLVLTITARLLRSFLFWQDLIRYWKVIYSSSSMSTDFNIFQPHRTTSSLLDCVVPLRGSWLPANWLLWLFQMKAQKSLWQDLLKTGNSKLAPKEVFLRKNPVWNIDARSILNLLNLFVWKLDSDLNRAWYILDGIETFVGRWFWNFCSPTPISVITKRHKKTYNFIKTQRMKTPSCTFLHIKKWAPHERCWFVHSRKLVWCLKTKPCWSQNYMVISW